MGVTVARFVLDTNIILYFLGGRLAYSSPAGACYLGNFGAGASGLSWLGFLRGAVHSRFPGGRSYHRPDSVRQAPRSESSQTIRAETS